jgi:prepilin-type N-terminal cleavage/methylation domain-containing protein
MGVNRTSATEHRRPPAAFTLIELLVVISVVALLIGILLPALGEARRAARSGVCQSNLRQFAVAASSYGADYQDRVFSFTWRRGRTYSQFPDLPAQGTDISAAAAQAIDILRRRADRPEVPTTLLGGGWIPHVLYSHLVLQDYLAQRLPEPMVVCPEDRYRVDWQLDPRNNFDQGAWLPFQPTPTIEAPNNIRWPYSSTYQAVPASYDAGPAGRRIEQGNFSGTYIIPAAGRLGGLRWTDITYPGGKVILMDEEQRHVGARRIYYALPQARQPLLFADTSVRTLATADANPGWQPNRPEDPSPSRYSYFPGRWQAPTSTGEPREQVIGHYRWTRGGLMGIDFGAGEPMDLR